jgi:arylsulfatase
MENFQMSERKCNRRDFLKTVGLGAAAIALPGCTDMTRRSGDAGPAGKPNIILIMADDMGFSDIGCYGGEINTPNLNGLAANGLRFTQFYNTARCCPTRASLLTGLYAHQTGIGHMTGDKGLEGYRGDLNKNCVTIAQVLKQTGYATYMAGKWHVTKHRGPGGPKHNWPLQRGFDRFYGTIHGAGSFYDPCTLTHNNTQIPPDSDDYYYTDAISDNAVKFIAEHDRGDNDKPFFLYVAYTAPHWPMHARAKDIARYKGRYDKGWDALRAQRHKSMIEMGIVDSTWPLTPRDSGVPPWDKAEDKNWQVRRMEVYAAMVDCMDRGIGRIVEQLEESGNLENTLILFLADNGGCAEEYGSKGPAKPDPSENLPLKPMAPGELQKDMRPKYTRDGRPVRTGYGVMPGPADTYIAYGKPWANASNTPFRRYKHWVHEGGIATPLIAHWPAQIRTRGELRDQPGHVIDLMATCADVAGAKYPAELAGHRITPLEGRSLVPAFAGKAIKREAIYWEHEGNRAVRRGRWKLVARNRRRWELYDMEADRTELNDLAQKHPKIAKQLAAMYEDWAKRSDVVPWGSWKK